MKAPACESEGTQSNFEPGHLSLSQKNINLSLRYFIRDTITPRSIYTATYFLTVAFGRMHGIHNYNTPHEQLTTPNYSLRDEILYRIKLHVCGNN